MKNYIFDSANLWKISEGDRDRAMPPWSASLLERPQNADSRAGRSTLYCRKWACLLPLYRGGWWPASITTIVQPIMGKNYRRILFMSISFRKTWRYFVSENQVGNCDWRKSSCFFNGSRWCPWKGTQFATPDFSCFLQLRSARFSSAWRWLLTGSQTFLLEILWTNCYKWIF